MVLRYGRWLFLWCASAVLALMSAACADASDGRPDTPPITLEFIAQIYGPAKPFDGKRSADDLRASCTTWKEPGPPDLASQAWYRAATTLHAVKYRTIEQHQQMLMLYEAAARRGHYLAVKNLTILYSEGALVRGGRFLPEPEKAQQWIRYGVEREWPGALEWVGTAIREGSAGFIANQQQGLAYLQQAADLGVPLAQYQLAEMYWDISRQVEKEQALLECAAKGDLSAALHSWAGYRKIDGHAQEAPRLYQRATMQGGVKGAQAAYVLYSAFAGDKNDQEELKLTNDKPRAQAYREIKDALDENMFLRFPRLNEVLPLPPAKMPPWKGIYSAMSPDDAAYYQNPPPAEFYIEEVRRAGYMVPDGYLSQPVPER